METVIMELARLLRELFEDACDLRRSLLETSGGKKLVDALPSAPASLEALATAAADRLIRERRADDSFFNLLRKRFPARTRDVNEVQSLMDSDPPEACPGTIVGFDPGAGNVRVERRGALLDLEKALATGLPVWLWGMGGSGKSDLVTAYVSTHLSAWPGGVVRVLAQERDPVEVWAEVAAHLLRSQPGKAVADAEAVLAYLDRSRDPVLIVFDEVSTLPAPEIWSAWRASGGLRRSALLPSLGSSARLLFVSRARGPDEWRLVNAERWEEEEVLSLYRRAAEEISAVDEAQLKDLVLRVLGGNALAVRLAAALQRDRGWTVAQTLRHFEARGVQSALGRRATDLERCIESMVRSLRAFGAQGDLATGMLHAAATLAPSVSIDREILVRAATSRGSTGDDAEDALAQLVKLALLEDGEHRRVRVHPIVSDWISQSSRALMEDWIPWTTKGLASCLPAVWDLRSWDPVRRASVDWLCLERHVEALASRPLPTGGIARTRVQALAGWLALERGQVGHALRHLRGAVAVADAALFGVPQDKERAFDLALYLHWLAYALVYSEHSAEAEEVSRRSVEVLERLVQSPLEGQERYNRVTTQLAFSLLRHANSLRRRGELELASAECERSTTLLRTLRARGGPSASGRALGIALYWTGLIQAERGEEALALAKSAFEEGELVYRELLEARPDDDLLTRDLGEHRLELGAVLDLLGDHDAARRAVEWAVESAQALHRKDPSNLRWLRDLAIRSARLGELRVDDGDLMGASSLLADAERHARTLLDRGADNLPWREHLARILASKARLRHLQGDERASAEAGAEALALMDELIAAEPDNPRWPAERARLRDALKPA